LKEPTNRSHPIGVLYKVTVELAFAEYSVFYRALLQKNTVSFTGLFCKRALQKRIYSAKETHDVKEPTNRSHLIGVLYCTE